MTGKKLNVITSIKCENGANDMLYLLQSPDLILIKHGKIFEQWEYLSIVTNVRFHHKLIC